MKKLLTGILATLTCFTCATAVACGDEKGPDLTNLNAAKDNLYSTYISKDVESYQDYEVSNSIAYDGVLYSVTWSVNVGEEIAAIKPGSTNKLSLVDLNNTSETNVPYTLTATIADADGNTVTVSFERTLLKAPQLTPEAITAAPVAGTTYKLYVYQSSKAADCYFSGMMSGFYFQTVENYEEAADVYVEYKADSTTEFYLYFNHVTDGKQYIGVQEGWNSSKSYWTFNVVFNATPPSAFVWSDEHKTIITTVPCRSDADNKNPDATEQPNTKTLYLGNYSTYMTISASTIDKAATSNVGGLVEMIDKKNVAPEKKIATIKEDLNVQLNHKMNKQIELVTADERFSDVTIAWAVEEGKGAVLTDNKLALTIPATATTVKLTATIACGETTDTKEFTLNLGPAIVLGDNPTSAEIVAAAFELENGEALPNKYTLEGVITKVNTAYSADYKNVTVTISVEGKEIECFRMKGDGADVIKAGDTINVTGTIKNYNGKVEFDSGCTLNSYVAGTETPPADDVVDAEAEAIVNAAYALTSGSSLDGTQTLTGVIKSIDEAYSSQYSNVTVTIVIGDMTDKPLKCYRMKGTGADSLLVGDKITVTGTIKNYNGTIEFDSGCTFVMVTKHTCSTYTEVTCKTPATCTVCGTAKDNVLSPNHSYNAEHICTVCNAVEPGYEGSVAEPTTVSVTIANMGWTNSTQYKTLTMDEVITVTANGGSNTGKYYTSGNQWRIYYSENPTVVVSAKSGYTIKTVKITYVIEKGGVLTYGEAQIASNTVVDVNAASITFGVDDTVLTDGDNGENKSGQVRITAIEVVYVANS